MSRFPLSKVILALEGEDVGERGCYLTYRDAAFKGIDVKHTIIRVIVKSMQDHRWPFFSFQDGEQFWERLPLFAIGPAAAGEQLVKL